MRREKVRGYFGTFGPLWWWGALSIVLIAAFSCEKDAALTGSVRLEGPPIDVWLTSAGELACENQDPRNNSQVILDFFDNSGKSIPNKRTFIDFKKLAGAVDTSIPHAVSRDGSWFSWVRAGRLNVINLKVNADPPLQVPLETAGSTVDSLGFFEHECAKSTECDAYLLAALSGGLRGHGSALAAFDETSRTTQLIASAQGKNDLPPSFRSLPWKRTSAISSIAVSPSGRVYAHGTTKGIVYLAFMNEIDITSPAISVASEKRIDTLAYYDNDRLLVGGNFPGIYELKTGEERLLGNPRQIVLTGATNSILVSGRGFVAWGDENVLTFYQFKPHLILKDSTWRALTVCALLLSCLAYIRAVLAPVARPSTPLPGNS